KEVLILSPIQMTPQGNAYQNTNSTVAFIGTVDWQTGKFLVENFHEIDGGLDFYAPQTCENEAGQRIMTAWMQMWQRKIPTNDLGHGWSGSMTLPRELRVADNQLLQRPVSSIYQVIDPQERIEWAKTEENRFLLKDLVYDQHYLRLEINLKQATKLELHYAKGPHHTLLLNYDVERECFTASREHMPYDLSGAEKEVLKKRSVTIPLENNCLTIEIFRDTSAIELFLNDRLTMSTTFYETEKGQDFLLLADSEVTFSLESGLINL
ncbi:TPA: GH32 C-terminal domain-containing protein, partial [Enterococcus faecium]